MAWVTGTAGLVSAVRSAKQFLTYVASGPFQYAVAEALRLPDAYFTAFRDDLRAKRDLLSAGLTDAGFTVFRPTGTYFVTADIRPLGESDGLAFCRALPERAGVVAIPNAVFYDHQRGRRAIRPVRVLQTRRGAGGRGGTAPEGVRASFGCHGEAYTRITVEVAAGLREGPRGSDGRSATPPGRAPPNRSRPPSSRG